MTVVRRVVTGVTASGRSYVAMDGPAPQVVEQPGRGLTFHELWATDGPGTDDGSGDPGARPPRHHPAPGGTCLRIVEFRPDRDRDAAAVQADLEKIGAADIAVDNADPTFHRNDTVDYNLILSGQIVALTESGEVELGPGDVLIQRGTAHTWSNRWSEPCVYASVMVSARPETTS